jgi:hypothetical protein
MSQSYFLTSKEWQKKIEEWQQVERRCLKCGLLFYEMDNIGKWQCKQHVLDYNHTQDGIFYKAGSWDCCGKKEKRGRELRANGCVRSDHTILFSPYTEKDDLSIEKALIELIVPCRESIINLDSSRQANFMLKSTKPGDFVVRRYDWKNADSRQETGKSLYDPRYK